MTTLIKLLDQGDSKKQWTALLLVLNEDGCVMRFALSKSKSLNELEEMFKEIATKNVNIQEIYSDECCEDRLILQVTYFCSAINQVMQRFLNRNSPWVMSYFLIRLLDLVFMSTILGGIKAVDYS